MDGSQLSDNASHRLQRSGVPNKDRPYEQGTAAFPVENRVVEQPKPKPDTEADISRCRWGLLACVVLLIATFLFPNPYTHRRSCPCRGSMASNPYIRPNGRPQACEVSLSLGLEAEPAWPACRLHELAPI